MFQLFVRIFAATACFAAAWLVDPPAAFPETLPSKELRGPRGDGEIQPSIDLAVGGDGVVLRTKDAVIRYEPKD